MASSGECEVYCKLVEISSTSGESDHYMRAELYNYPQKNTVTKKFFKKQTVIKYFDSNKEVSLGIKHGTYVLIEVPTAGLKVSFIVPELDSYNVAEVI